MSLCKMQCEVRGSKGYVQTTWIATAQLGEAILMVLIFFFATLRHKDEADPYFNQEEEDALDKKLPVLLIYDVIQLALAFLLYVGNKKERIDLLRIWVAIQIIVNILGILGIFFMVVYSDKASRNAIFLILGFMSLILICIVKYRRIP